SVDDILVDAQKTVADVIEFFVGKENAPDYVLSIRCLEVSVDVAASSTDVLSGDLKFNLHFAVVHRTDDSRSVGKVLALQWKFGESAVSNINNVATALTSPLPPDLTGCRIPPKSASFSNIILSINDAPIVYAGDLSETLPATFGEPVNVESTWTVTDPALYEVTIDLGQGRDYVEVWQHTRITEATKTVRIPPNLRYDADGAGVDDDGVGRFVITATLRVAGKDTPLKTLQLPVVVSDDSTVGHRINLLNTPSGNVFEGDRPAVSSTFTLRAGETKARSWFEVRVGDDGATFRVGGQDVSDFKFGQRTHNVAYDPRTWPNTGTITTERFALPVLRWDSETEQTILTHVVEYGNGAGAIRDRTSFVFNVQDDTPYFTQICSEDLCLDRDGSGPLLVASPDTRMLVGLIDPGLIEGSRDGVTRANLREQVDNPYIVTMDGGIAGGLSLFGGEDLFRLASGRLSGLSYEYDLSRPELRDYEPGIHWVSWGVGCWSCPGTSTIEAPLLVVENNDEWKPNRASIPEGRSGWYSTAIATFDEFEGACGAVNFVVRAGAQSEFIEFAVVDSARPFDLAAAKNRVKVTDRTFGTPSDLVVANGVASWTTVPNQKYYIGVTDDHDQGSGACKSNRPHFTSIFQVELTRQPAAPVNDAFSRRVVLETQDSPFGRLPFSSVDLTRATTGAFEAARIPSCWSDGAQNTVFYEYWIPGGKPDRPVLAEAIPFSDEFGVLPPDAQLAVYQLNDDDSVGPEVGCSNASSNPWVDDVWAADGLSAHPVVAFTAKSTERYVIVVDTEGPAGRIDVRVSLPGQLDPIGIAGGGVVRLNTSQGLTKAETKGTLPCAPGSVTRVGAVAWRASTNAPVRVTTTGSAVLGVVKIGENGVADGWPDALGSAGTVNIACGATSAGGLDLTPVQGQQYVFLLGTAGSADVEVTVATTGEAFELPVGAAAGNRAGYWMVDVDGRIYAFGDGQLIVPTGARAPVTSSTVKVLENPSGVGLWVLEVNGTVHALGGAPHYGNVDTSALLAGEVPATMAATPGGKGYYVFTSKGRVLVFGDAVHHGDLVQLGLAEVLRGDIVDSSALTDGSGYYMVGSDGGIFAFGAAEFAGSIPQVVAGPLVSPVNGLVADPDGRGYWLVAGDGGVFAFDAPFVGSLPGVLPPGTQLASPVNGLVPFGDGYMMVAGDGGIFNFSSTEFLGSLGGQVIPSPIVGVAPVRG
ncbi:MAG: hypothetical protein GXP35_00400, partial [Actinobacteria bacterium]|nr:hypothetical protein [Actinomycetota bacterium]